MKAPLKLAAAVLAVVAAWSIPCCSTPQQTDSTIKIIDTIAPIISDLLKGIALDAKGDSAVLAADAYMSQQFGPDYIAVGKAAASTSAAKSNAWSDWSARVAVARARKASG